MFAVSPLLYTNFIFISILILTLVGYSKMAAYPGDSVIDSYDQMKWMGLFIVLLTLFLGLRPLSPIFADTMNYAQQYRLIQQGIILNQNASEWLFNYLIFLYAQTTDAEWFFLTIEILYIVPMFVACRRLVEDRAYFLMLFCIGAFSFYTYAVNGLRQGVGCSITMLALTYIGKSKRDNIIFGILAILALGFHKSVALPLAAAVYSLFYKNPQRLFFFWIVSIGISLVAGGAVENIFSGLGFDDRVQNYLGDNAVLDEGAVFSRTGFRWDFLLYSAMPILLGWYVVIKRELMDDYYYVLLTTYILSNAFWVMIIRAPFSNRFAYLSWFLYPIVLAYPLMQFPVFNQRHSQKAAMILIAHFGFTFLMWMIGKL